MAKKKINAAAMLALTKWREEHTDKDGHLFGVNRKTTKQLLAEKQLKLKKLEQQVADVKAQIAKLDASINKKHKADSIKGLTADELDAAIAMFKASK